MHIFERLPQILWLCPIVKFRSTLEKSDRHQTFSGPLSLVWDRLVSKQGVGRGRGPSTPKIFFAGEIFFLVKIFLAKILFSCKNLSPEFFFSRKFCSRNFVFLVKIFLAKFFWCEFVFSAPNFFFTYEIFLKENIFRLQSEFFPFLPESNSRFDQSK